MIQLLRRCCSLSVRVQPYPMLAKMAGRQVFVDGNDQSPRCGCGFCGPTCELFFEYHKYLQKAALLVEASQESHTDMFLGRFRPRGPDLFSRSGSLRIASKATYTLEGDPMTVHTLRTRKQKYIRLRWVLSLKNLGLAAPDSVLLFSHIYIYIYF